MTVFHKLKILIFTDVTHPRLLDAKGTDSTFPQNVCIYWPPHRIILQDLNLHLQLCQNLTTLLKLLQCTLWDLHKL